MLIWLDSTINRKAKPNENYARELMELFSLGRGHYTERDVKEAARAFTGWFVVRDQFQEVARQHDDGVKTVLGRTGPWTGDDIPKMLLDQPACAELICRKLVRHFVSETHALPDRLIAPLARAFRESGYQVVVPIRMILTSNLFYDPSTRHRRVKSPVEFAVGTIRALEIVDPTVQTSELGRACERMGQSLYAPPSVAGWDGGPAWINSTTMLARANLALGLLSDQNSALGGRLNPRTLAARHGFGQPELAARFLLDLLVQDALEPQVGQQVLKASTITNAAGEADLREVVRLILTSSEYQLG
jgi:uncharacterized protein (DUF1800 family)